MITMNKMTTKSLVFTINNNFTVNLQDVLHALINDAKVQLLCICPEINVEKKVM